jgi:cysteine desulfurase
LIHADSSEVVFTCGGTEADNLAVLGAVRSAPGPPQAATKHVVTSAIEHPAVLSACAQLEREGVAVTRVKVGSAGVVNPDDVRAALRPETVLISVMHANNELGTIQPIVEIGRIAREAAVPLHVDGVQALGKIPVDVTALGADLYSMSGHKLCAPKGVGALYVRKGTRLAPLAFGGHQERERRPGTENVPGAVALGAAAELAGRILAAESERLAGLRDRFENTVLGRISGARINGARWSRVPNTSNLQFDGVDGEALVIALDLRGFAVSTGAACSSGAIAPSHVLTAIGLDADRARASMRFSLGRANTAAEVDGLAAALEASVAHLRRISVSVHA